jgi:hypothetical protein
MRSNSLKHNNLMLRSERRERLEAWTASDSSISQSQYWCEMLALFAPFRKTAQKMRNAIAFGRGHAQGNQVQRCTDCSPLGDWRTGEFVPGQSLGLSAICPICSQKQPGNAHRRSHKGENFRQLMLQLMLHGAY